MQSTSLHAAIILDGNGRWAQGRGLPREAGHRAGADAVRGIVQAAPELGIGTLTLYAFSSDNWQRPGTEVAALLGLLAEHLRHEVAECRAGGVRLSVVGRRDRLPLALRAAIATAEQATANGRNLWLRIAIDYSARDQILRAAERMARVSGGRSGWRAAGARERFRACLGQAGHGHQPAPDVDLLVRTGGERRLSDFLLWEIAYAELFFTATPWPEFGAAELKAIVEAYHGRERRFGALGVRRAGGHDAAV